jgi:hypothetical protein
VAVYMRDVDRTLLRGKPEAHPGRAPGKVRSLRPFRQQTAKGGPPGEVKPAFKVMRINC